MLLPTRQYRRDKKTVIGIQYQKTHPPPAHHPVPSHREAAAAAAAAARQEQTKMSEGTFYGKSAYKATRKSIRRGEPGKDHFWGGLGTDGAGYLK